MSLNKGKPVVQIDKDSGIILNTYKSLVEAAEQTSGNRISIGYACSGKYKTSGGFMWGFLEE